MAVLVISYSRVDRPQVEAVVSLLRAALRQIEKAVYWDGDFEPGDPWFEQIQHYIDDAPQLFVFWCVHSAGSKQVRREFTYALERSKRVVPVLLDDTPLDAGLAPIHGIDLRRALVHGPQPVAPGLPTPSGSRPVVWAVAITASIIVASGLFLTLRTGSGSGTFPGWHAPLPQIVQPWVIAALFVLLGAAALIAWAMRKRTTRTRPAPPADAARGVWASTRASARIIADFADYF